jgi:hypothetical protein
MPQSETHRLFQVLDNFTITALLNSRLSRKDGPMAEGVWFILNSQQTQGQEPPLPGQMATIHKPDGSVTIAEVVGAEKPHSVIALTFKGLGKEDVPRLSEVEW